MNPMNSLLLLFDLDGVLLSEEGYLDTVAITMSSFAKQYFPEDSERLAREIFVYEPESMDDLRRFIFPHKLLDAMRTHALNSNWDKAYAGTVLLGELAMHSKECPRDLGTVLYERFLTIKGTGQELLRRLRQIEFQSVSEAGAEDVHGNALVPSPLFAEVKRRFQRFYLGDDAATSPLLQKGLIGYERLLCDRTKLLQLFTMLHKRQYTFGIGTGRPRKEALYPLERSGLLAFFDQNRICTSDDVLAREQRDELMAYSLAKPHPYTYESITQGYAANQVVVIGDSPADLLAAREAKFHFIGIGKKDAFQVFSQGDQVTVIDSVEDLPILFS